MNISFYFDVYCKNFDHCEHTGALKNFEIELPITDIKRLMEDPLKKRREKEKGEEGSEGRGGDKYANVIGTTNSKLLTGPCGGVPSVEITRF